MRCQYCNCTESKVIDSRPTEEGYSIRRRRECISCGRRFTTYEKIELAPLMVIKRDGRREVFDVQKVKRGEMPRSKVDECFKCQLDHLRKGNSFKLLQRYCAYYKSLWR